MTLGIFGLFNQQDILIPRATFSFDFYDSYFIILLLISANFFVKTKNKFYDNKPTIYLFVFLFISFVGVLINGQIGFPYFKTILSIIFTFWGWHSLLSIANYDVELLIRRYYVFAFYMSIFAIVQEVFFLGGIQFFGFYHVGPFGLKRVCGLSGEPYYFATIMLPAVFMAISYLFKNSYDIPVFQKNGRLKSLLIIVAFILTFSSIGLLFFVLFLLICTYKMLTKRTKIGSLVFVLIAPILVFGLVTLNIYYTSNDKNFGNKSKNLSVLFNEDKVNKYDLEKFDGSSFALSSNILITKEAFKDNPAFGFGLGNYELVFEKYFGNIFDDTFRLRFGDMNKKDGNSGLIRLIAETGIVGILMYLIYIITLLIKRLKNTNNNQINSLIIFNHAILFYFIIRLLRTGNYITEGYFFFYLMYYYTNKIVRKNARVT